MVSAAQTSRKYKGEVAKNYEIKRSKQERWHLENAAVRKMLQDVPRGSWILDAPVGIGRFFGTYQSLGFKIYGVDSSQDMLGYAAKRLIRDVTLHHCNILDMELQKQFHTAVCVRFLDLIPEDAMQTTLQQLRRFTTDGLILTIRLGPKYIAKSNTATHDEEKFFALMNDLYWRIAEDVPIFKQGWHVFKFKSVAKRPR